MATSSDRYRELHDEAHRERRNRIREMSPFERMEEAYRLFKISRPDREHPPEEGPA